MCCENTSSQKSFITEETCIPLAVYHAQEMTDPQNDTSLGLGAQNLPKKGRTHMHGPDSGKHQLVLFSSLTNSTSTMLQRQISCTELWLLTVFWGRNKEKQRDASMYFQSVPC